LTVSQSEREAPLEFKLTGLPGAVNYILIRVFILPIVAVVLLGIASCEPSIDVTFENKTEASLLLFVNGNSPEELEPLSIHTFTILTDDRNRIAIKITTEPGDVLLNEVLTEEELEQRGRRIVIGN